MDAYKCNLKFAFVDIFLCVLLVLGLLVILLRPKGEHIMGEYTLLLTVPKEYASCFLPESELLDGVGKGKCGRIASVTASPALFEGSTGVFTRETHIRLTVLVRGEATKKGNSLTFGTLSPLPGKHVFLHMPCVCEGVCLSAGTEAAL